MAERKIKKEGNQFPDTVEKIKQRNGLSSNGIGKPLKIEGVVEEKIKLERGVETLFRITSRRHIELTTMAHNKASLLISINTIIISVVLSILSTQLQSNRQLVLPTVLLILTSVCTIVTAIISTLPKILGGRKSAPASKTNENNILFFGHFLKMTLHEYKVAIRKTILDKDQIYDSLSRDIYYQGLVLDRKYKYITISYYIFIVGLIVSTFAFMLTFIFYTSTA